VNIRGNIAFVAIQFPITKEGAVFTGTLGSGLSTEEGYRACRLAAINCLAQLEKFVGLTRIEGLNHIDICYKSAESWDEAPIVANGASDVFIQALGAAGIHTRSIFGAHSLPRNHSVGVTASFTLSQ